MEMLKVSARSNPSKVAGALANVFKEKKEVQMQMVGAGALNQAIKSIIICRGFLAPSGKNIMCIPSFSNAIIDGGEKTAIKLDVEVC